MSRFGFKTKEIDTIIFGSDHAGYYLKSYLKEILREEGYKIIDKGAYALNEEDDYPDFVIPAVQEVLKYGERAQGIILGGSGQGEAITANRFKNIRAIVFNGQYKPADGRLVPHEIVTARQHNDANVLSLGARFLNQSEALHAVKLFLETPFSHDERHIRRIEKIEELT